jgi:hypothetical protein
LQTVSLQCILKLPSFGMLELYFLVECSKHEK